MVGHIISGVINHIYFYAFTNAVTCETLRWEHVSNYYRDSGRYSFVYYYKFVAGLGSCVIQFKRVNNLNVMCSLSTC